MDVWWLCDIWHSLFGVLSVGIFICGIIQFIRLLFSDGDLSLMWYARFGKNLDELRGDVIWITGASSGIGEYLAYELSKYKCKLVISARRINELERVKKKCLEISKGNDEDILVLSMDMLDTDAHIKHTSTVLQHFGKIDILMNNAGRSQRAIAVETSVEVDRQILELNTISVLSLTKAVLPHMIKQNKGHVAVTSSVAGKIGAPMSASYSCTKFALQGWFDALRNEVSEHNITVTTICPGPVHSNIVKEAFTSKTDQKHSEESSPSERRVLTDRCAYLIAVTLVNKLEEVWISLNPILLFTYAAQYLPTITKYLGKKIGVKAIHKLREGRERMKDKQQ